MDGGHTFPHQDDRVSTEMSLHILAYNLKRVMNLLGVHGLLQAISACGCFLLSVWLHFRKVTRVLTVPIQNTICKTMVLTALAQCA